MKLLKKKNRPKTNKQVISDMRYCYDILIKPIKDKPQLRLYSITITDTGSKHQKDLLFKITNKVFNSIHSEYRLSDEIINYLFVIEYSKDISRGMKIPDNVEVHTHIVMNTTIPINIFKKKIKNIFINPDIFIEDITKRDDREDYIGYLIKQGVECELLNNEIYNYKIDNYFS